MANESQTVSRKEYLQKYISGDIHKKKEKKKRPKKSTKKILGLKIIDNDIDIKSIDVDDDIEDECGDEVPMVAQVIDERPRNIQLREQYNSTSWKRLGSSDEEHSSRSNVNGCENISLEKCSEKKRHDSDSDLSPSRDTSRSHKMTDSDGDMSPPRNRSSNHRTRHDSDDEISPQNKLAHASVSSKKTRSKTQSNSDSDLSPPRTHDNNRTTKGSGSAWKNRSGDRRKGDSDSDLPPERTQSHSQRKKDFDQEKSVHNKKDHTKLLKRVQVQGSDSDVSPPRKTNKRDRPSTTLMGMKAGLQNSSILREEMKKLKERETQHILEMDEETSGRHAKTVHRDRATGRKRDLKEEQRQKQKVDQKEAEKQEKYAVWGKGVEQDDEQKKRLESDMYEMTKPLARYRDDEDLDRDLRDRMHVEDPMFEYMQKKKKKQQNIPDFPKYAGPPPPPNRFSIVPGYRWDGVDRSNGFEKRYFEKANATKAKEVESHLWSVQDM